MIEKANASAALQEARNEYSAYLVDVNYAEGYTAIAEGYIFVKTGEEANSTKGYYAMISNGSLTGEISELDEAPELTGKTWTQVSVVKDDKDDADASNDVKYNVWYAKAN